MNHTVADYMKYANLQMAAEAHFGEKNNGSTPITSGGKREIKATDLVDGKTHASSPVANHREEAPCSN